MDKCFVEQVLLPAILDDPTTDASIAALMNIVESSYSHFKMVDMVSVGMHEAETLSELRDTLSWLMGLLAAIGPMGGTGPRGKKRPRGGIGVGQAKSRSLQSKRPELCLKTCTEAR